jgi:O-antigen ligase
MLKNIYNKAPVILIALLPIGLLISSGVSELLCILIVMFYIGHLIHKKDYLIKDNIYFKLLLTLWIYLIINSIFSEKYQIDDYSLRSISFIKYILLIFAFGFYLNKNQNLEFILFFWTLVISIVTFDIFYEHFVGKNILGFESPHPSRIVSFLRKELKIGNFVLGFCFLTASYLFYKSKKKSISFLLYSYLFFIITILSIYLTGERSNSLRVSVCLIIFFILGNSKILKYKNLFIITAIASIITLFLFSDKIQNRFNGQVLAPIKKEGIIKIFKDSEYGAHYDTSIKIFESYPMLGVGNKNFRNECAKEKYYNSSYKFTEGRCTSHPHQIYLEFLSEHGLIGTMIILGIIFIILYKNIKIYKKNNNLIHLASIIFVAQTFLPIIPSGSFFVSWTATIFWVNFAIMIRFALQKSN